MSPISRVISGCSACCVVGRAAVRYQSQWIRCAGGRAGNYDEDHQSSSCVWVIYILWSNAAAADAVRKRAHASDPAFCPENYSINCVCVRVCVYVRAHACTAMRAHPLTSFLGRCARASAHAQIAQTCNMRALALMRTVRIYLHLRSTSAFERTDYTSALARARAVFVAAGVVLPGRARAIWTKYARVGRGIRTALRPSII